MAKKQNLIRELAEFKKNVNKVIPIDKLILFGSHATGKTHRWSDVDLVIVSTKFKRKRSFKRANKLYDYWNLRLPVDFLCYTPEEFNRLRKQVTIVREAANTGINI